MNITKWLALIGFLLIVLGVTISYFTSDTTVCENVCEQYDAELVDSFFNVDQELMCECDTGLTPDHIIVRAE